MEKDFAKDTTVEYDHFLRTKEKRRKHFDKIGHNKYEEVSMKKGSTKKSGKINLNQFNFEDLEEFDDFVDYDD